MRQTPTSRGELRQLPSRLYPLKAAVTRARSGAWLVRARGRPPAAGIRILFYHRVCEDRDTLAVTPKQFGEQMDFLAEHGYRVVDLVEAARLLDSEPVPAKVLALTFDDGYLDVAKNALPVLDRHGFLATVFVVTGAVDRTISFEWYERQPALLSWADVVRLDGASPFRFEAHTITHPNLLTLASDEARQEIAGSKQVLEQRLGRRVEVFSYPAGLFSPRDRSLVEEAGYSLAVSCEPGSNKLETDRFALHRNQIDARDSLLDFRAKIGGGHDSPLPLRGLYRRMRFGAPDQRGSEDSEERPRAASSRR
jgi:peptidoglycan/xylan/chitin deacetylase (PgdA/CDA1 family)